MQKIISGFKMLLVILVMANLAACSTYLADKKQSRKPARVADASDVYTSGIGQEAEFESEDNTVQYTETDTIVDNSSNEETGLNYAHNQTYYFDFDNSRIKPEFLDLIKKQANYLLNNPNSRILLAGHTDERGSREYNVALGERRAKSVYEVIRLMGVPERQIRVLSYGREQPAVVGRDESTFAKNRRVELVYEAIG